MIYNGSAFKGDCNLRTYSSGYNTSPDHKVLTKIGFTIKRSWNSADEKSMVSRVSERACCFSFSKRTKGTQGRKVCIESCIVST
jgi:hypothetical protein